MHEEIVSLLKIVKKMQNDYPKKKFTLDGRLVGDIGEILAAEKYDFKLYDEMIERYDGETEDGKKIQVKATMKKHLTFPTDFTPDYYLGILIDEKGNIFEVYNGPGKNIKKEIKHLKPQKTGQHVLRISMLKKLNSKILDEGKIKERK
jgi:hypothetical protein